jgi:hypothetical protein
MEIKEFEAAVNYLNEWSLDQWQVDLQFQLDIEEYAIYKNIKL